MQRGRGQFVRRHTTIEPQRNRHGTAAGCVQHFFDRIETLRRKRSHGRATRAVRQRVKRMGKAQLAQWQCELPLGLQFEIAAQIVGGDGWHIGCRGQGPPRWNTNDTFPFLNSLRFQLLRQRRTRCRRVTRYSLRSHRNDKRFDHAARPVIPSQQRHADALRRNGDRERGPRFPSFAECRDVEFHRT